MVFVIEDLDETHLLVDPSRVDDLREQLEMEVSMHPLGNRASDPSLTRTLTQLEKNTYTLDA